MPGPLFRFPRRVVREFESLLQQLHEQGLTWLDIDDVINHLGPVASWSQQRGETVERTYPHPELGWDKPITRVEAASDLDQKMALQDLCVRAGWPLPLEDGGRDHTTPAALAVFRAKQRLADAMVADSAEQGVSANTIADRARNAQSRPTTLKILAVQLLFHDACQAMAPLWKAGSSVGVSKGGDRLIELSCLWDDEPPEQRRKQLDDAQRALTAAGLHLHDPETGTVADIHRLAADDHKRLEIRRTA